MRCIFDTNVLIDGFQDEYHAGHQLIRAVIDGEVTAIASQAVMKEYKLILYRLITDPQYLRTVEEFMDVLEIVNPVDVDETIDDPEDYKFLEAAVGGKAEMVVTSDRHLLDLGRIESIPIGTPQEAWAMLQEEQEGDSEWKNFVRGLGIG